MSKTKLKGQITEAKSVLRPLVDWMNGILLLTLYTKSVLHRPAKHIACAHMTKYEKEKL